MIVIAVPLDETEANNIVRLKHAHGGARGIDQWPPDLLPVARMDEQAVRVMQLRPEAVLEAIAILTVDEHAGQGRDPQALDTLSHEQPAFDVHAHLDSRVNHKLVGAGRAGAVQQSEYREGGTVPARLLDPELPEHRELLGLGEAAVQGQSAGRKPILVHAFLAVAAHRLMRLAQALGPEIARAQKGHELLVYAILEHRIQQAKAGESRVGREALRNSVLSVVE